MSDEIESQELDLPPEGPPVIPLDNWPELPAATPPEAAAPPSREVAAAPRPVGLTVPINDWLAPMGLEEVPVPADIELPQRPQRTAAPASVPPQAPAVQPRELDLPHASTGPVGSPRQPDQTAAPTNPPSLPSSPVRPADSFRATAPAASTTGPPPGLPPGADLFKATESPPVNFAPANREARQTRVQDRAAQKSFDRKSRLGTLNGGDQSLVDRVTAIRGENSDLEERSGREVTGRGGDYDQEASKFQVKLWQTQADISDRAARDLASIFYRLHALQSNFERSLNTLTDTNV